MSDEPGFAAKGLTLTVERAEAAPAWGDAVLDRLARLVGFGAIGLPFVLAGGAVVGLLIGGGCFRDSISHFYHTQFLGAVFVGLLFFIGGFMVAYTGDTWLERIGSTLAGLCAFGVALFPTAGPGCEGQSAFLARVFVRVDPSASGGPPFDLSQAEVFGQSYFNLFGTAGDYHLWFAGGVFAYLGLFCLLVLRRVIPARHGQGAAMLQTKRRRNRLYFWCGVLILACAAALGLRAALFPDVALWNRLNLTFWIEAVALWAFGAAWLAKGRLFARLNDGAGP